MGSSWCHPCLKSYGMKKTNYTHHHHHCHHHNNHHHDHNIHHCHSFSFPIWCRLCLRSFGSKIRYFPFSRLVKFQDKNDFQPIRLSSFLKKKTGNYVYFFKDSLSFWATALIFKLSKGGYNTIIEFYYGSPSPRIEGVLEKRNIAYFCPHFGKFNFRAKLYWLFITIGAKRLHIRHPRGILNKNLFFGLPMALHKTYKCLWYLKCFFFVDTNLTANYFGFLTFNWKWTKNGPFSRCFHWFLR